MALKYSRLSLLAFQFCTFVPEPVRATSTIISKTPLNHDCYLFRFKFLQNSFRIGIGQYLQIVETIKTYDSPQGEEIIRKYTPINPVAQQDILDILIKIYRPNVSLQFPNGGKLTPFLEKLKVGDKVHMEGPFGKLRYESGGNAILSGKTKQFKKIFFMAGGSGITPCYQIIRQILAMPNQNIELALIFANKNQQDIVLKQLKLFYILDKPSEQWTGMKGYITDDVLKSIVNLDDPDTLFAHCGPKAMNNCLAAIFKQHHPNSTLFKL